MKKLLIGLVIGLVAIIAVITLSPLRFVLAPEPLRPYHATSQNYLDTVADFESTPIKDKDDLYSRYEIIANFLKHGLVSASYEGKQAEVTVEDMHILFNQPDQTIEVPENINTDTIYQYKLPDTTVHLHTLIDNIDEIIYEETSGQMYDNQELDAIFLEVIQTVAESPADKDAYENLVSNVEPTRKIQSSAWIQPRYNSQYFYDDGNSNVGPEEFVVLNFSGQEDDKELQTIDRRYRQAFDQLANQAQVDEQKAYFTNLEDNYTGENITEADSMSIRDLEDIFGDIYTLSYDLRRQELMVTWYIREDEDDRVDEIMVYVPADDLTSLTSIEDLSDLQVSELETSSRRIEELYAIPHRFIAS